LAKESIIEAKKSGADAVKFQSFKASRLVSMGTPKVNYQLDTTSPNESHYEMIKKLELSDAMHIELFEFCNNSDRDFFSTPYDVESAKFLNDLGVPFFKTASADITDFFLHEYISTTGKPVLIATGMANLDEIQDVLNIYRNSSCNLTLLHCVSSYPASDKSLNLKVIDTLIKTFNLPVGYSDHSIGSLAASLAVALGVKVIEKHFTLNKNLPGPDHKASSNPSEFAALVNEVRRSELILGSRIKSIQPEEVQMSMVSTVTGDIALSSSIKSGMSNNKLNKIFIFVYVLITEQIYEIGFTYKR